MRVLRRPPAHAALFTPILFSFSLGWGFVNYVLATAIAAWALVAIVHAVVRPGAGALLAVAVLGLACAFAHVLAMLILCAAAAALALELSWRVTSPSSRSFGARWPRGFRLLRAVSLLGALWRSCPLAIGCVYCIAVYQRQ